MEEVIKELRASYVFDEQILAEALRTKGAF
jgi:hypothetical protein